MREFTITFTREKETRNTVRFSEQSQEGEPPVVGYLYLQRWAAGQADAVHVVLTTEDKDAAGPKRKA